MSEKVVIKYRPTPTAQRFHQDDSFVRAIMGPVGCFSGDTEYLTPDGWKRFADGPSDVVAQYDPETDVVSFVEPEEWHEGRAELFDVKLGGITQRVTGNHRVLVGKDGAAEVVLADELVGIEGAVPVAPFRFDHDRRTNITDAQIKLQVCLLLSAKWGSCWASRLNATITLDDEQQFQRLKFLMDENGLKPRCTWLGEDGLIRGRMPYRIDTVPTTWWYFSPAQLKVAFEMLREWRYGAAGTFELATGDRKLVDWAQYAAMACGWQSWFIYERGIYTVYFSQRMLAPGGTAEVASAGVDNVYCYTVPSGFLVVRYNGQVFISGNSGKSVACLTDIIYRAMSTPPGKDGVRRSRGLIGRRTYPQLRMTTIKTFMEWYGHLGTMKWDSPITFSIRRNLPDNTRMECDLYFMSLDGPVQAVADKLKSLELTFAFLNEAAELDGELIPHVISRLRRYPSKRTLPDGVEYWSGLVMDANPPSTVSWWYDLFERERPRGWRLFKQPGALIQNEDGEYVPNPKAENVENHTSGYRYWLDMIPGMPEPQIRSLILGEYAPPVAGKPVYPMFLSSRHVADQDLEPQGRANIVIGCDWGLFPAAVITTMSPTGTLMVLEEIVPEREVRFEEFRDEYLLPVLFDKYRGFPLLIVGDPSGTARSAHWNETVFTNLQAFGLAAEPAATNSIAVRIQAVSHFLKRTDGFLLSPSCRTLREGFEGGYRFKRTSKTSNIYSGEPEKNEFSHVHDALQYAALVYYDEVASNLRAMERKRRRAMRQSKPRPRRALV